MDPEAFQAVEALFERAVELDEDARKAFLAGCGEPAEVVEHARRLLEHASGGAAERYEMPIAADVGNLSGTTIDRYHLLEPLGEGGFGVVYEAEQTEPVRRRVALKVIKLGMDTRHVIARFEAERQTLALMDHPGIARVLDAGATDSGRPYFVMELVAGIPITDFCDATRMPPRARVELFVSVCHAVEHAHQKGIIHRDIKPSNVLVMEQDGTPTTKVIDFGIAKAMSDREANRTRLTELRQMLGTPEYMSPEQAEPGGGEVDTRSDIYSMGVVLYELLVGVTPFASSTDDDGDLLDRIKSHEPTRPSTRLSGLGDRRFSIAAQRGLDVQGLRRSIRGDLDWIVLKALAKEPSERYATATEFARDIERVLTNEPVLARPPRRVYLVRKYLQRHRAAVASATAIALALVGGLVMALLALRQADRQRDVAEDALAESRRLLWRSYVEQARATRSGTDPGRRFASLEAIKRAAAIESSAELRDLAIACMGQADIRRVLERPGLRSAVPEGQREIEHLATLGELGVVEIASATTGEVTSRLVGPELIVRRRLFSPDGRYLAVRYDTFGDLRAIVFDVETGERLFELESGDINPDGMAFDPTGETPRWLAFSMKDEVTLFELPSGRALRRIAIPNAGRLVTNPDGDRLAVIRHDTDSIDVVDIATGDSVTSYPLDAGPLSVAWSNDGSTIAAGTGSALIHVWRLDAPDDALPYLLRGHQGAPVQLFFSEDDGLLASFAWDNTLRVWDLTTAQMVIGPLSGHNLLALSDKLVTDGETGPAFWTLDHGEALVRLADPGRRASHRRIRFAHSAPLVLTSGASGIIVWDVRTGRRCAVVAEHDGFAACFAHDDSAILAVTADGLMRWPFDVEAERVTGPGSLVFALDGARAGAINPSMHMAAVADRHTVVVVDTRTGEERALLPAFRGLETKLVLSPDGARLFAGTWKGEPGRVWHLETGEVEQTFEGSHVTGAFSPDGTTLLTSVGESFSVHTGPGWRTDETVPRNAVDDLAGYAAFDPTRPLAALSKSRFAIDLVDTRTYERLATIPTPGQVAIGTMRFSPDGRRLAATTRHGVTLIWDLDAIGERLATLGLEWDIAPSVSSSR